MDKAKKRNRRIDKILKTSYCLQLFYQRYYILIIVIVALRGFRPFFLSYDGHKVSFFKFITGTRYFAPEYRIGYIIINTMYVVLLSVLVSAPISVLTALLSQKWRSKVLSNILTKQSKS